MFPFLYRGKNRHSCVVDNFELWCSTTYKFDVDKTRGVCEGKLLLFNILSYVISKGNVIRMWRVQTGVVSHSLVLSCCVKLYPLKLTIWNLASLESC